MVYVRLCVRPSRILDGYGLSFVLWKVHERQQRPACKLHCVAQEHRMFFLEF